MRNNKCPKCKSIRYKILNISLLDDKLLAKSLECRGCHHKWDIRQSLISEGNKYKLLWIANERKNTQLHRWVWEQKYGRLLREEEVIHHKNFNKGDNRVSNLVLMDKYSHNGWFNSKGNCKRCNYSWIPRKQEVRICPKCKSPYFDIPRRKKK